MDISHDKRLPPTTPKNSQDRQDYNSLEAQEPSRAASFSRALQHQRSGFCGSIGVWSNPFRSSGEEGLRQLIEKLEEEMKESRNIISRHKQKLIKLSERLDSLKAAQQLYPKSDND